MQVYIWASEYLSNYARGSIVVFASCLQEARDLATVEFYLHDKKNYDFGYYDDKDVQNRYALFEQDILKDPVIRDNKVFFSSGSH